MSMYDINMGRLRYRTLILPGVFVKVRPMISFRSPILISHHTHHVLQHAIYIWHFGHNLEYLIDTFQIAFKTLTTRQQNSKDLNHLNTRVNRISSLERAKIQMLFDNNHLFFQVGKLEVEEAVFRKLKMDTNLIDIPDGCKVILGQMILTPLFMST